MYIYPYILPLDQFCDELHAGTGPRSPEVTGWGAEYMCLNSEFLGIEFQNLIFSWTSKFGIPKFPNFGIQIPKFGISKQQKHGKLREKLNCIISQKLILDLLSKFGNSEI